ncbi:hypothetical protein DTW90_34430 [Neorhizobium sp. P12A]|uniref:phage upper tail fiber protein n=1 Tax=Neorhizobium sp. P12A TaxID=2268027 RepID=UPI0011ED77F8|nr:hypothetical protein [Neorhizobium sp. P12A]KAA0685986.1 hypothetical protein DTW90_34430 [Neorhizobium sp. P12A]
MHVSPPADGSNNPITVNGRSYSCTIGQALTVPDQDGFVMRANGWSKVPDTVAVGISQAAYNALPNPDPNTLYVITG